MLKILIKYVTIGLIIGIGSSFGWAVAYKLFEIYAAGHGINIKGIVDDSANASFIIFLLAGPVVGIVHGLFEAHRRPRKEDYDKIQE